MTFSKDAFKKPSAISRLIQRPIEVKLDDEPDNLEHKKHPEHDNHKKQQEHINIPEEPVITSVSGVSSPSLVHKPSRSASKAVKKRGRPAREMPVTRLTVTLSEDMAEYLEIAWRTHKDLNGRFSRGPSGYIEDLIARDQRSQTRKTA